MDDSIRGGMLGLLVGDACGVPYEFNPPSRLAPFAERIDMVPPPEFDRTYSVPPGTWSDDGALALCLLESLVERGAFDPEDQARRMVAWMRRGHLAVENYVFDIGGTTAAALRRAEGLALRGESAVGRGETGERSQGNGSLMRILPLALWHRGDDAELARLACVQSGLTHAHPTCEAACAVYCLWARGVLNGEGGDVFASAMRRADEALGDDPRYRPSFDALRAGMDRPPTGTGFVVDTLFSARWAVERHATFEGAIRAAILLGHDTDTTAAVAGGIAGLRCGVSGLPARWLDALRSRDIVDSLLDRLIAGRG